MTFEIELNGCVRSVSIERDGDAPDRFLLVIDGQRHRVDAMHTGDRAFSMLEVSDTFEAQPGTAQRSAPAVQRVYDVQVSPGAGPGEVLIHLGGRALLATVNGRRTGHSAEAGGHAHGELAVVAPMPGRVVRVLVNAGEEVAARQGVVVVEAMKMENELRAPKAGRVRDVSVAPGESVEVGRVLVVIE